MSVYENVFDKLKGDSFNVFPPNIHEGECKFRYVVLKDAGKIQTNRFSSQTSLLDVLCYVPGNRYTDTDEYVNSVKQSLKGLFPLIIPTGTETPPFYDDTVKGWMVSVEYRYTVRSKHLR